MINPDLAKRKDELIQKLQSQLEESKSKNLIYEDLQNLQNEPLFRQQILIRLDRIALALENLELGSSEEEPESEEELEEEEDVEQAPTPTTKKK